jgi:hypothetical protein
MAMVFHGVFIARHRQQSEQQSDSSESKLRFPAVADGKGFTEREMPVVLGNLQKRPAGHEGIKVRIAYFSTWEGSDCCHLDMYCI